MPHVTLRLEVASAAAPLGHTSPPAPKISSSAPPHVDLLRIWLLVLGVFLCTVSLAAADGARIPQPEAQVAPRLALPLWLARRAKPPPPPPPLPPPERASSAVGLTGALLLLVGARAPKSTRRQVALVLVVWGTLHAVLAARFSADDAHASGRLRFHYSVALISAACLHIAGGSVADEAAGEPPTPAEAWEQELRGSEHRYGRS